MTGVFSSAPLLSPSHKLTATESGLRSVCRGAKGQHGANAEGKDKGGRDPEARRGMDGENVKRFGKARRTAEKGRWKKTGMRGKSARCVLWRKGSKEEGEGEREGEERSAKRAQ